MGVTCVVELGFGCIICIEMLQGCAWRCTALYTEPRNTRYQTTIGTDHGVPDYTKADFTQFMTRGLPSWHSSPPTLFGEIWRSNDVIQLDARIMSWRGHACGRQSASNSPRPFGVLRPLIQPRSMNVPLFFTLLMKLLGLRIVYRMSTIGMNRDKNSFVVVIYRMRRPQVKVA